jgi:hypothetical protein
VEGSHHLSSGPTAVGHVAREPHLYTPIFEGTDGTPALFQGAGVTGLPPRAMPNLLSLEVPPGGAALEHTGGEKRRCFILGYGGVFVDAGAVSGFALGTQGYGAGFKAEALEGLEDAGLLTKRRRGLLGLPPAE